jgi:hypothetical protein
VSVRENALRALEGGALPAGLALLDLAHNSLLGAPPAALLAELPATLHTLDLSDNLLTTLPPAPPARPRALAVLRLARNPLAAADAAARAALGPPAALAAPAGGAPLPRAPALELDASGTCLALSAAPLLAPLLAAAAAGAAPPAVLDARGTRAADCAAAAAGAPPGVEVRCGAAAAAACEARALLFFEARREARGVEVLVDAYPAAGRVARLCLPGGPPRPRPGRTCL